MRTRGESTGQRPSDLGAWRPEAGDMHRPSGTGAAGLVVWSPQRSQDQPGLEVLS